MKNKIKYLI